MEIWDYKKHKTITTPPKMESFLKDIVAVYKKYGLSLSHEDCHGAFIVEEFDEHNVKWLYEAGKDY